MEIKFRYRFEAAHRFTKGSTKCTTPHGHTWYATLFFNVEKPQLDDAQMLEEFSSLKAPWKAFIENEADHSFFHHEKDPILPSLKEHIPNFRGLSFPGDPTTEMVAAFFFLRARNLYGEKKIKPTAVLIEETPTNSIFLSLPDLELILPSSTPLSHWVTKSPLS